jgi:hypothetical protein
MKSNFFKSKYQFFIIFIGLLLFLQKGYSQSIIMTDKDDLISALHKKTFIVSNYGEIKFILDKFDKDFLMFSFKVEYTIYGEKKNKTYDLRTSFPLTNGGFYIPDFYKDMSISQDVALKTLRSDFPTRFQLLQNGELYFLDKFNSFNFENYYNQTIKKGEEISLKQKWVLCKQK